MEHKDGLLPVDVAEAFVHSKVYEGFVEPESRQEVDQEAVAKVEFGNLSLSVYLISRKCVNVRRIEVDYDVDEIYEIYDEFDFIKRRIPSSVHNVVEGELKGRHHTVVACEDEDEWVPIVAKLAASTEAVPARSY